MKTDKPVYEERVSSPGTEALFLGLTAVCLGLSVWRYVFRGGRTLAVVALCGFLFFLFYSLNYRTLLIRLSPTHLVLTFGIFTWRVALNNIDLCYLDTIPAWQIGGAGIHFRWIGGRYRAYFNFLEHPRVVVRLKRKKGPVRETAFTTSSPDEVMGILQAASAE